MSFVLGLMVLMIVSGGFLASRTRSVAIKLHDHGKFRRRYNEMRHNQMLGRGRY